MILTDSFGRRLTYLRVSVTDRCNYRCVYCVTHPGLSGAPARPVLPWEQIAAVASAAGRLGFFKLKLTGGEPLTRRDLPHLVEHIAATGFYRDIGMTTNAALLTRRTAGRLRRAGLQRVNISLDTLDPHIFSRLTRGGVISDVFRGIDAAQAAGLHPVKINMVVSPDTNDDDIAAMRHFCGQHGLVLQTIRQFSLPDIDPLFPPARQADRPPPCRDCNRLRLTADGQLRCCLRSDIEIPVDFEHIEQSLLAAAGAKPACARVSRTRTMCQIGG